MKNQKSSNVVQLNANKPAKKAYPKQRNILIFAGIVTAVVFLNNTFNPTAEEGHREVLKLLFYLGAGLTAGGVTGYLIFPEKIWAIRSFCVGLALCAYFGIRVFFG